MKRSPSRGNSVVQRTEGEMTERRPVCEGTAERVRTACHALRLETQKWLSGQY